MSLINNVLKEIELRPSHFKRVTLGAANVDKSAKKSDKLKWYLWASLLLLAVLIISWGSIDRVQFPEESNLVSNSDVATVKIEALNKPELKMIKQPEMVPTAKIDSPVETLENSITGLQLKETSQSLLLQFRFIKHESQTVNSFLRSQSEQRYRFHIKNTRLEIPPPQINNRWLKLLQLAIVGNGVDIIFHTRADILLESDWITQNNNLVWQVKLTASESTKAAAQKKKQPTAKKAQVVQTQVSQPKNKSLIVSNKLQNPEPTRAEVKLSIKPALKNLSSAQRLQHADRLMRARQWAKAENQLLALIHGDQDRQARVQLLSLYRQLKKVVLHTELLAESVRKYPSVAAFKTEQAMVMFRQGQYTALIKLFATNTGLDATQYALIGASFQRLEQHKKAIKSYQQSIIKAPGLAKNWIALAISQEQEQLNVDALNSYKNAARLDGLNAQLRGYLQNRIQLLDKREN